MEPGIDSSTRGWLVIFQLIGVNHRSAPLAVRERFAIPEARLLDADARLAKFPGVEEALVISTFNRTDLLVRSRNGSLNLRVFPGDYFQLPSAEFEPYVYEHSVGDAIRHLFRVTASVDSMVIGEPQILGQVKEAYTVARAAGAIHSHLDTLVTLAFAVAKKVRRETSVGSSAVSVASVAVELARKIFGSLKGGIKGPNLQYHVGGGAGGINHFMEAVFTGLTPVFQGSRQSRGHPSSSRPTLMVSCRRRAIAPSSRFANEENKLLVEFIKLRTQQEA